MRQLHQGHLEVCQIHRNGDAAGHRKFGRREQPCRYDFIDGNRGFEPHIHQPQISALAQILRDHPGDFVSPLDAEERELRFAHRFERDCFVGGRRELCGARVAVDRSGLVRRTGMDCEVERIVQLILVVEHPSSTGNEPEPTPLPQQGVRRHSLQDIVVKLQADRPQVTVAGDHFGTARTARGPVSNRSPCSLATAPAIRASVAIRSRRSGVPFGANGHATKYV